VVSLCSEVDYRKGRETAVHLWKWQYDWISRIAGFHDRFRRLTLNEAKWWLTNNIAPSPLGGPHSVMVTLKARSGIKAKVAWTIYLDQRPA
jgi:hypothetical protein